MTNRTPLPLHLRNPILQIMRLKIPHIHRRHKPRRIRKQIIHLLQRPLRRLRLNRPEENRIGEIAHHKHHIELPSDRLQSDGSDLADHGVEGERCHGGNTDALGARSGVKDLSGDDPGEGAVGGGEGEVVEPGDHDEGPRGGVVARFSRRKFGQEDRGDDKGDHVSQVASDHSPSSTGVVDEKYAEELCHESNDAAYSLIFESI